MNPKSNCYSMILLLLIMGGAHVSFAQILTYAGTSDGTPNYVAPNTTSTNLLRVNGAQASTSPCSTGFSSSNFSAATAYSNSLSALQVSVVPNQGSALNVTSFAINYNRSNGGPKLIRFAYSTDGGNTWISESSNHSTSRGSCGKNYTLSWSTTVSISAPATLIFRAYGFSASKNSGLEQISGLNINGTVSSMQASCGITPGLSASNIMSSSATLDWTDVSGATSYNIHYRVPGTSTWTSITSSTSTVNVSGLASSTTYEYQVQTVCSGGTSAYSSSATFMTAAPPCSVPTGLTASNITSSSATLDWTDVSGATSYNIHYRVSGTSTWTSTTSSTSTVNVSGLASSTTYECQVQTVCSGGTSAYSSSATFMTAAPPCSVPTGLTASNIMSSSATLDWTDVSGATSYNIHYRVPGTSTWTSTTSSTSTVNVSGLASSTTYECQVQTVCSGGTSAYSSSATFMTAAPPCSVPTGLTASNITSSSATLDWTDVSGATSYNIQYRVSGTSTWTSTTSSTSTVNVSGLASSTTYEYQVQTVCSGGTSAYSSSSTFMTAAPPCSVPTGLTASNITSSSATLDWTDVSGATSYNIHYRVSGTSTWTSTTSSTSTVNVSGLASSTTYECQVQTVCSGGTSAYSSSATFMTAAPPCSVPTGLTASNITSSSATLDWTDVSGATSYNIQYRVSGTSTWTSTTSSTSTVNVSGLASSTTYECQVQTVCSGGTSAYSSSATFMTAAPPCSVPTGLTASNITSSSATLDWTDVSGATSYNIQYRVSGTSTWTSTTSSTSTVNVSGLASSTTYECQVQTVCSGGTSAYSSSATFMTAAPPCSVPSGLTASNITSSSATSDWTDVSGATSYNIHYRVSGTSTWTSTTSSASTVNVSGLASSTTYECQVQTVCSGGTSAYSSSATFTTAAPPCSVPSGLTASNITSSSATLDWTDVSGATSYNIQYRVSGTSTWTSTTSSTSTVNVSGLASSTTYECQVQTVCSGGTSAYSSSATFMTAAPPCSVPTGLTASNITSSSATLDWTDVSGATSYNIHYRVSGTSTWTSTTSSASTVNVSGLASSTTYECQVQTVCSGGTSAYSASATFTTAAPPCSVPTGLTASNITSSSATLDWTDVSGATSYNIHYRVSGTSTWTSTTSSASTVNVSGLASSSTYECQVQTVCSGGTSAYSSSATFTTAAPPCSVPSGLTASNITSSSATLDWADVSGATSYNIHYRVSGTSTWTSTTSSASTVNVSGLASSTTYECQVQTVCSGGTSAYSASATFMTAAPPCSVPSGLTASNITSSSATLDWTDVSGATSYNIHYRVSGTSTWTSTTSSTSTVNVSGLASSTTYECQVQTVCSGGTSAYSASATFTTAAPPCSVPTGLTASNITSSSATLDWTDVSGATSYNIHYRVSGTSTWTSTTSSASTVNVSGLASSSTYECQVQTVCSGGTSAYSSSATFTTAAPPCSVPSGLTASNITSSSATLDWTDVSGATSYNIHYRVSGTSTWTSTTSSASTVNVSGLASSSTYECQVQTVCSGGTSAYSSSATFTTLASTTSSTPTPDHIVVLILENHGYSKIIGSSAAPHINALANDAASALFTQSYAIEHPSQPNYLDLYSGSNQGVTDDNVPAGTVQGNCSTIGTGAFTTANLGKQLIDKALSWATYSEDLPCTGFEGATSNNYARKHNPAANWQGSGTNQIPSTTNKSFSAFPTDYTQLPTVCYVVPNQNNDMHNGSDPSRITTADNWMYNNLNGYIQWAKTHNSLFILTFDEDDNSQSNHIVTIFTGAMIAGGQYSNTINHYSVLRTIEDMYGLSYAGKASLATTITNCWKSGAALVATRLASLSNAANKVKVTVYPNPATSAINFKLDKVPSSAVVLRIYDMTGRLMGQYQFAGTQNLQVNLARLPAGNYYYNMIQNNSMLHSGIFTVAGKQGSGR